MSAKRLTPAQRKIAADALRAAAKETRSKLAAASSAPAAMQPPPDVARRLRETLETLAANQDCLAADFADECRITVILEERTPT